MSLDNKIIVGTRGSRLSLAQAEHFKDELLLANKNLKPTDVEIKVIKTSGDKFKTENLSLMGGKGLFVKEIEKELLTGNIDCAVHSLKDIPTFGSEKLVLGAYLKRKDARDAFISPVTNSFKNLKPGSTVATCSVRRISQLQRIRDDIKIVNIRGNIDTRIEKLKEGLVDGLVLAYAGIKRLGFHKVVTEIFDKDAMLPAAGQGTIVVQTRLDNKSVINLLKLVNDKETEFISIAERSCLDKINGACDTPIGVNAVINDDGEIFLRAELLSIDGKKRYSSHKTGIVEKSKLIGYDVAEEILDQAGTDFIIKESKLAHTIYKRGNW